MSPIRKTLILTSLMMGASLASMDLIITGAAMPSVVNSFGGLVFYSWICSGYLLSSTIAIPISGRLADVYGRKPVYISGALLFVLGSVLCSVASTTEQLTAFRAIQGLGAGAILPVAMTIIADIFSGQQRARVQALFGSALGAGTILGPAVGLVIAEGRGWHWIFLINLPIGLLSALILGTSFREELCQATRKRVDYAGAISFAAGIAVLLATLQTATSRADWFSLETAGMVAISATILGLFVMIEASVKDPMLPLSFLFSNRVIRGSSITGFLVGTATLAALAYVPLFCHGIPGGVADRYATIPLGLGWLVGSGILAYIILHLDYRHATVLGSVMIFAGSLMLTLLEPSSTAALTPVALATIGLGLGFSTTALLLIVQDSVKSDQQGLATSSVQFFRAVGGIMGVSLLGILLNSQVATALTGAVGGEHLDQIIPLTSIGAALDSSTQESIGSSALMRETLALALHWVFWGILGFALLSLIASLYLPPASAPSRADLADGQRVEETEGPTS